jgi:hypothetical protein
MESDASKPCELPGASLRGSSTMVMKVPWLRMAGSLVRGRAFHSSYKPRQEVL